MSRIFDAGKNVYFHAFSVLQFSNFRTIDTRHWKDTKEFLKTFSTFYFKTTEYILLLEIYVL